MTINKYKPEQIVTLLRQAPSASSRTFTLKTSIVHSVGG
jgi:hypothetical protein